MVCVSSPPRWIRAFLTALPGSPTKIRGKKSATVSALLDPVLSQKLSRALCNCLVFSKTLVTLELPGIRFNLHGIRALAKGLKQNQVLSHLNLSGSMIGDEGFYALAGGLVYNDSLHHLVLSSCNLTDASGARLAELLQYQYAVIEKTKEAALLRGDQNAYSYVLGILTLDLSNNLLGDRAACILSSILRRNTILVMLDMRKNQVNEDGVKAVKSLLEINEQLIVDLSDNPGITSVYPELFEESIPEESIINGAMTTQKDLALLANVDDNYEDAGEDISELSDSDSLITPDNADTVVPASHQPDCTAPSDAETATKTDLPAEDQDASVHSSPPQPQVDSNTGENMNMKKVTEEEEEGAVVVQEGSSEETVVASAAEEEQMVDDPRDAIIAQLQNELRLEQAGRLRAERQVQELIVAMRRMREEERQA
jgi:hypothetical protein